MKKSYYERLVLYTIITIFTFVCIFAILSVNRVASNRTYIVDTQINKLQTVNELAASSVREYFGKIKLSLKTADIWLANNKDIDPRFDKNFISLVNLLEADMLGNVDLRLVTKGGKLFYIPSESTTPLADVGDRAYFLAQRDPQTRGFFISEPVLSRVTGKWGIPISYPLSFTNKDISIIFAAIEIPTIEKIFQQYQMKQDGSMLFVRGDGIILATAPFDAKLIGKSISDKKLWRDFIKNNNLKDTLYETDELDGTIRYITYTNIPEYSTYVISTCVKSKVLDPWNKSLQINVLLIILCIVVFIAMGVTMATLLRKLNSAFVDITVLSNTDTLTGLPNRRFFVEKLKSEIALVNKNSGKLSIAIMDIDHFKNVNDTFGHDEGDFLLKYLSEIMKENMRETDLVARWGGEEFVLLFANTDVNQAAIYAENIRRIIEKSEFKNIGNITASFGVSEYTEGEKYKELLTRADKLLYQAKNNGRNRVQKG